MISDSDHSSFHTWTRPKPIWSENGLRGMAAPQICCFTQEFCWKDLRNETVEEEEYVIQEEIIFKKDLPYYACWLVNANSILREKFNGAGKGNAYLRQSRALEKVAERGIWAKPWAVELNWMWMLTMLSYMVPGEKRETMEKSPGGPVCLMLEDEGVLIWWKRNVHNDKV